MKKQDPNLTPFTVDSKTFFEAKEKWIKELTKVLGPLMKKQRLFDESTDDWTPLASVWGGRVKRALRPIVEDAVRNNISMRDLKTVIDAEVGDLIIYNILENLEKTKTKD